MKLPIDCVVIEDEPGPMEALVYLIDQAVPDLSVVGQASSLEDGYWLILAKQPKLVFLDIHLEGQSGFELLSRKFSHSFEVVLVTAYSDYALKAFEKNVADYLVKPIKLSSLIKAAERVKEILNDDALDTQPAAQAAGSRLKISTGSEVLVINHHDILFLKASRSYSEVHLLDGSTKTVSKPLGQIEPMLSDSFFKTHRSYVINLEHIRAWNKSEDGYVILSNDAEIPVSRTRRTALEELI